MSRTFTAPSGSSVAMAPVLTGLFTPETVRSLEQAQTVFRQGETGSVWHVTGRQYAIRKGLPPLRELAEVVDAKTETVCRALAQLMPHQGRSAFASLDRVLPLSGTVSWQDTGAFAHWQPKAT